MMDSSYAESWMSQPDVCRCCLSASGTWDVTSSYITEAGEKEVYTEMLQECYGITLSSLVQFGPSRMVCALCVGQLRNANNFRKQVLLADQQFEAYSNARLRVFKPVVLKAETPHPRRESSESDNNSNEGTIDVLALTDYTTDAPVVDRVSRKKKPVAKTKTNVISSDVDEDLESDTPISEISKKNHVPESIDERTEAGDVNIEQDSVKATEIVPKKRQTIPHEDRKLVAEKFVKNQNLRDNITLILKYTTVLPFKQINNNQFFCHYCDRPYVLFKDLKNHIKVRHWNILEKDIKRTIIPRDMVKADISDISCRLCGSNYNTIEKMVEHLKGLHSKTFHAIPEMKHPHGILGFDLSSGKLKCAVCAKDFRFFKQLSVHMNEHNADYICHICGKRFVADHRLANHIARHNRMDLKCNICNLTFSAVKDKEYHNRKVHKPLRYKCPECSLEFSQYLHRMKHMVQCHKMKKPEFRCQYCSKEFAHHSAVAKHIKTQHVKETNKFLCEICDKTFSTKFVADRHLNVHLGKKNFVCNYCDKKFAKKYALDLHIKIHFDEKEHICSVCEKAFVQKSALIRHMKAIHSDSGIEIKKVK